ncbi:MAG: FtsQ-type POTRA domain-containing protein [Spirochaetaceae bacterium]|nr:FtsQ-type POTRA domain-containing protein [Spirochaetaceae bacterium]
MKIIKLFFIILLTILLTFVIVGLRKSDRLKIEKVEIICDKDKVPKSVYDYLDSLKGQNILFINKKTIETKVKNNPVIESIQIKREFPKKIIFYLKKRQVNVILRYNNGNIGSAILANARVMSINNEDVDSLSKGLIIIECDQDSLNLLIDSENISSFNKEFNIILANYHLISSVYYCNRGSVEAGFFEIKLNDINALLRFREFFDEAEFRTALIMANNIESSHSVDTNIILDVYHGAIVERQK